ncbi:MAG: hypothetical protein ACLTSZ_04835 [Lachnospiraceae bacterium]
MANGYCSDFVALQVAVALAIGCSMLVFCISGSEICFSACHGAQEADRHPYEALLEETPGM